ncbi:/ / hypothetical protein / 72046:72396 Forward [Candidatus Hepatoplasma crinochetorum]|uniref:Uncharacterized protein n=1 Tax=Candidatus Hepatoplasma crinochetorum TaxID=295596 RepID=A0A0G7ZNL6_9MOLU|nr:/ / hypothetical protein / 72046:72396 Forward [Candidatus Hepatoplasma crinochetorum]
MHKKRLIRKIIINLIIVSFFIASWSYFFLIINKDQNNNLNNDKPIININNLNDAIIKEDPFVDYDYFQYLWINDFENNDLKFEPIIYFGYNEQNIYVKILDDQKIVFEYKYFLVNNQIF